MIVECEQQGNQLAEYAKETILLLSDDLSREFGKGYSVSNLEYMRSFYITDQSRISQSLIGDMEKKPKSQSVIGILENPFQ